MVRVQKHEGLQEVSRGGPRSRPDRGPVQTNPEAQRRIRQGSGKKWHSTHREDAGKKAGMKTDEVTQWTGKERRVNIQGKGGKQGSLKTNEGNNKDS